MGLFKPDGGHRRRDGKADLMSFRTLDDMGDISGKRVLVREDLNVPMADGKVTDDTRLRAAVPTLSELSDRGSRVLVMAHFGRPKGQPNPEMSLRQVVPALARVLGRDVAFIEDCAGDEALSKIQQLPDGAICVLENTRFHAGEEKNDPHLVAEMAKLGDLYVNDAFSAAHRAHASTEGLAHNLPAFAGRAMQAELEALQKALGSPEKPVAAVVGGAKVSTKLDVLKHLVARVDHLIIGGGMANTFLAARGVSVGKSLCEHDLAATAEEILDAADKAGCTVHLPYDVVVAKDFAPNPPTRTVNVHEVAADEMILDVGPAAVEALGAVLKTCRTLVWNGPLGYFENKLFIKGSQDILQAVLRSKARVIIGGGETVELLNKLHLAKKATFVSTGGGAMLEFLEGKKLPALERLREK